MKQKTIKNSVSFSGVGLHSGINVNIKINPAKENTGIVFKRVDLKNKNNEVRGLYNSVISTGLGTTIGTSKIIKLLMKFNILKVYGVVVKTIEHFMASLWACDIDNAIIEIDNEEIPIMDGSADIFIKEIQKAGIQELNEDRKFLVVKKEVEIKMNERYIKLSPYDGYKINLKIDFNYGNIGEQLYTFNGNQNEFIEEISKARTFCNIKDVELMKKHNLALGGSEDNAMVFDDSKLLNKDGFRYDCEPARHKLLDCVGDMFTSGYFMKCLIETNKGGHTLNNLVLKKLFSDKSNYTIE